jgi:hypothetical protein
MLAGVEEKVRWDTFWTIEGAAGVGRRVWRRGVRRRNRGEVRAAMMKDVVVGMVGGRWIARC